ncbi:MAG: ankyrin repeat domain-containing protein, partial [Culicoidibacterales bacterium]
TLLLNAGANEAILNKSGETAQFITQKPKVIELQELWEIMTDFDEETVGISGSKLTLLQAVEENNQQQVAQFLQTEIDINIINQDGDTPLHLAVMQEDTTILQLLLKAGANIESENEQQETPLFTAIHYHNAKAIGMLLAKGANVHWQNDDGDTPLHVAIMQQNVATVSQLLAAQANPLIENDLEQSAIELAEYLPNVLIKQMLKR